MIAGNFELLKSQRITKVSMIHPQGSMNVCTKFLRNPFSSYGEISVWTKVLSWLTDSHCHPYSHPASMDKSYSSKNKHLCRWVSWQHSDIMTSLTEKALVGASVYTQTSTPWTAAAVVSMIYVLFSETELSHVCACTRTTSKVWYLYACSWVFVLALLLECIWIHVIECECVRTGAWYRKVWEGLCAWLECFLVNVCRYACASATELGFVFPAWMDTVINTIYFIYIPYTDIFKSHLSVFSICILCSLFLSSTCSVPLHHGH